MNGIKEWAAVVCIVTLVAALMQYLVPDGSMAKMMKMLLGVFVICGIILPLSNTIPKISLELQSSSNSNQDTQSFKNSVDQQIYTAANTGIQNIVINELNLMNMNCENVQVLMDTKADNSISISKVVVSIPSQYANQVAEIAARLEKVMGLKTEVIVSGRAK